MRVNAQSRGTWDERLKLAADGLRRLSDGKWLSGVMNQVNHSSCGTLPDFGKFRVSRDEECDRHLGVTEQMPFAMAVTAKMMKIVAAVGYQGWVGIEYEGSNLSERDSIRATKKLLEKVPTQMMAR